MQRMHEVQAGDVHRVTHGRDGQLLDVPVVVMGTAVPEEAVEQSRWERWLSDGVMYGFMATDVADSLLRRTEDGHERIIVEVGTRVKEAIPIVQYGDGTELAPIIEDEV